MYIHYQWQSDPKHYDIWVISWQFKHFWANNWQRTNNLHRTIKLQFEEKNNVIWSPATHKNHPLALKVFKALYFSYHVARSDWVYANEFVLGVHNCGGKKKFAARTVNWRAPPLYGNDIESTGRGDTDWKPGANGVVTADGGDGGGVGGSWWHDIAGIGVSNRLVVAGCDEGVLLATGCGERVLTTRLVAFRGNATPIFLHVAANKASGLGLPKSPESSGSCKYFDARCEAIMPTDDNMFRTRSI